MLTVLKFQFSKVAEHLEVRLLIDAEYTYMNPALRILSLAMMLQFNKHRPLVAYTYQNYLKVRVPGSIYHPVITVLYLVNVVKVRNNQNLLKDRFTLLLF